MTLAIVEGQAMAGKTLLTGHGKAGRRVRGRRRGNNGGLIMAGDYNAIRVPGGMEAGRVAPADWGGSSAPQQSERG